MANAEQALQVLQELVDLFSTKELPNYCVRALINAPEKPSSHWSFSNNIIMLLHGTTDARGYRQWRQVARYVKQGSRAVYILGPIFGQRKFKETQPDPVTGEEKEIEVEHIVVVGFKSIPVFRYEDTDGQPLPEYKPKNPPPLLDVAHRWGVLVKYNELRGAVGAFSQSKNEIILATEDWDAFFHELAHKGDSMLAPLKNTQDPEQEAVAELSAATLARLYGHNYDGAAWQYIARYAGERTPQAVGRLCFHVLSRVEKVLKLILAGPAAEAVTPQISLVICCEHVE